MTTKEFVDLVFANLDDCFQSNLYFQELKRIVYANLLDEFDSVSVNADLYSLLPEDCFLVEVGPCILEFLSGSLYLNIVELDGTYIVELKMINNDSITSTIATIKDFSRIQTSVKTLKDGTITNYTCDVYYYQKNKLTPLRISGENYYCFASDFHIPLRLAPYFMNNFLKFGDLLQSNLESSSFDAFESCLEEKDYYAFIGPFDSKSFVGFIKGYAYKDFEVSFLDLMIERGKFDDIIPERLGVLNDISSFLGNDGASVITYSLYQAILLYLTGLVDTLNARGFIIKALDGVYTLYFVSFCDNKLFIDTKSVSHDEVLAMYNLNEFNFENEVLASFFETGLGR